MIQRMFVTLDTKKTNYKNVGKINHGDDLILELTVLSDGDMISFNDPMVDLLVKKSDGKMIRQNSGIEHIKPNKFIIEVSKDCVTSPGLATNQLIINDNGRISTCMFYYTILNSLEEDIIESISNVEVLEQLDEFTIQMKDKMENFDEELQNRMSELEDAIDDLAEFFGDTSVDLVEAELSRNEAEQSRAQAELVRVQNENRRLQNDLDLANAEAERVRAENVRIQNEVDRALADAVMDQKESEREDSELERIQNESKRTTDELVRQQNESTRQSNESIRMSNENDRKTQENRRVTAETNRVNAETTRRNNENSRISNETERQKTIAEMKSLIDDVYGFDERIGVIEDDVEEINSSLDNKAKQINLERQRQYSKIRKDNEISFISRYIFPNTFNLRYDELPIIFTDDSPNFTTNFDVANYKNIGGKNVYVDIIKGTSSNDGLNINTPCQSLAKALTLCSDNDTIIILNDKDTIFYREHWFSNGIINKNINVISLNKIIHVKGDKPTWIKEEGFSNVYKTTRTKTKNVVDLNSKLIKYKKVNSIQEVNNTYYSWFTDETNVYINSRFIPNEKVIPLIGTQNAINNDNTKNLKLYLENITLIGGDSCINITGNSSYNQHELYTKNCELYVSSSLDCCLVANSKRAYHQNTICGYSAKDGFNYSTTIGDSNIVDFIEVNCKAYSCGDESVNNGSYHNGSTAHAKSYGIRVNGVYYNNVGGNVIDVAGAKSVNLGCITYDSLASVDTYRQGIGSQGNQGLMDCEMWLNGCISFGNLYDIYFISGSIGHIEKCQYDTIVDTGKVYKDERL